MSFDENEKEIINLLEEKLRQLKFKNKDLEQRRTRAETENEQLKARCIELEQEKEKLQFSSNVSTAKIKELELLKTVTTCFLVNNFKFIELFESPDDTRNQYVSKPDF